MKVSNLEATANPGGGRMEHVATFDAQVTDDILVCGMRLLRAPDGRFLSYAPTALGGRRSVTFSPETAAKITDAATRYFQEHVTANDISNRSAA
ncbi:hypothetical protein QO004_000099 [Rhizobium mesoamericanum]|uniref:hypothetical protein n=1 Tax=Rhizobium mesoamericanum TaxID=1079800 RepID=UPI0027843B8F|nr:hypothetical protein [Rhizobium mesoamericanum]MDQ0558326.1 hypothetical protein [Rhizobium mesoamericanum]